MAEQYDVVVIGGGSNSLTAAAYLAKIGKKVLVLEKNAHCGGGVVSMSTAPGFIHDPHASGYVLGVHNPVIAHDELGLQSKFGLQWFSGDVTFSTAFDDDTGIQTFLSLDRSCESIAQFSAKDAETYRRFVNEARAYIPMLLKGMFTPPIPFGAFVGMAEQNRQGQRLVTAMLESAYDVLESIFESPELKMHILKWVAEMMVDAETKGTGLVPFLLMGICHDSKMHGVVGGSANLTRAFERCIVHYGGTIRCNADVVKVNVRAGRATGVTLKDGEVVKAKDAVVANIHPWDLGDYLEGIDPHVVAAARNVKLSSYGALNQQIALAEAPIWRAGPGFAPSMWVECMKRDLNSMRAKFDEYRYGQMTRRHLSPLVSVMSNHDRTRAPAGKAAMYLYHFAPLAQKGGIENWDEIKEEAAGWVFDEMCKYTTNIDRSKILGWHIESPLDHHRHSKMMRNGDIFGVGSFAHQSNGRRPNADLAQYKVPGLESFYLAGATQHPGGTVLLGGRATAMKMLMDWKVDLNEAFVSL
ncbi:MAG TPA: NAD(P)/FAD-dependent oxidoreductase [Steroidobacteraceae bacterium]|nr:NAD(P)/FAD-dependent oxidoreductase [Steroidobacteraceae bacterium]